MPNPSPDFLALLQTLTGHRSGYRLLMTRLGPLDLQGAIGANHDYEDLCGHVVAYEVSGLLLRVLDLETLIRIKEEVGFEKDRAVLPLLRRTLLEKTKPQGIF